MTEQEILNLAKKFVGKNLSRYVWPATLGMRENNRVEVIFIKVEALDPDVVIDPPDFRVWVDTQTRKVTKILQM